MMGILIKLNYKWSELDFKKEDIAELKGVAVLNPFGVRIGYVYSLSDVKDNLWIVLSIMENYYGSLPELYTAEIINPSDKNTWCIRLNYLKSDAPLFKPIVK